MAEIVFTCRCGMILKVYDEDQIGKGLACPSCSATVIVPPRSESIEAPGSLDADGATLGAAGAATGKWFGLVYLSGIAAVSVGLIKFVLMPALSSPNPDAPIAVARADEAEKAPEADEADEAPRRLKTPPRAATKKSALGKAEAARAAARPDPRLALAETGSGDGGRDSAVPSRPAADDDADKPDDAAASSSREPEDSDEGSTTPPGDGMRGRLGEPSATPPIGMRRGRGGMPAAPRRGMPAAPRRGMGMWPFPVPRPGFPPRTAPTRKTKPREPLKDTKPIIIGGATGKKSDYEHIDNPAARKALEAAAINARDALSAGVAENFLRQAEEAGKGDEKVSRAVQALRHKILMLKDRSR